MTMTWDDVGNRFIQHGVDRGVLYVGSAPGVPWSGLTAVTDKSPTDAPVPYYFEGRKYFNQPSPSESAASIEALFYPDEFAACEGALELIDGVTVYDQMPVEFGLCYRTMLGSDILGGDFNFKLHFLYRCLVTPAEKAYRTRTNTVNYSNFSWEVVTTPVDIPGARPSPRFEIDGSKASPYAMRILLDILYGAVEQPRLPTPAEILELPWNIRQVLVARTRADINTRRRGDVIFVTTERVVYTIGEADPEIREVYEVEHIADFVADETVLVGDLIHDTTTDLMYQYSIGI